LISLDIWETIRIRCVRDKEKYKRVARDLGISKNTVKKYALSNAPPSQIVPSGRAASMARFEAYVDQLLRETPKITAMRIAQVIRQTIDPDFRASERSVREYVASRRARIVPKEAFVRLVYLPGDQVQFDFKDVVARVAGIETKLHMFVARLSYSTAYFARCYRSEDRPALFDGLVGSCVSFGGVAREGIFDNATTAVKRVLRGRDRQVNAEYAALCGSLALGMQFAAPAKGNEKGGVEGLHGVIEDALFRPMPNYGSLSELNAALDELATKHLERRASGELVRERFERERAALRPLPAILPSTCVREAARINKFAEITHKTNRYSTPSRFAHRAATIEVFHDRVRIVVDTIVVAEHERCFGRQEAILDPVHFIDLLSFKHRAVVRAEVFRQRSFHHALRTLLSGYVENDPLGAGKRFMRVIALLEEYSMHDLVHAVEAAQQRGTDDPAAIALTLRQGQRPYHAAPPLCLDPATRGTARPTVDLTLYDITALKEYAS
jgi:transposase